MTQAIHAAACGNGGPAEGCLGCRSIFGVVGHATVVAMEPGTRFYDSEGAVCVKFLHNFAVREYDDRRMPFRQDIAFPVLAKNEELVK